MGKLEDMDLAPIMQDGLNHQALGTYGIDHEAVSGLPVEPRRYPPEALGMGMCIRHHQRAGHKDCCDCHERWAVLGDGSSPPPCVPEPVRFC